MQNSVSEMLNTLAPCEKEMRHTPVSVFRVSVLIKPEPYGFWLHGLIACDTV